jgi:hypothetical protein
MEATAMSEQVMSLERKIAEQKAQLEKYEAAGAMHAVQGVVAHQSPAMDSAAMTSVADMHSSRSPEYQQEWQALHAAQVAQAAASAKQPLTSKFAGAAGNGGHAYIQNPAVVLGQHATHSRAPESATATGALADSTLSAEHVGVAAVGIVDEATAAAPAGAPKLQSVQVNSLKVNARKLAARAATAYLLSGGYRGRIEEGGDGKSPIVPTWCINTCNACLRATERELTKHKTAEEANKVLSTRLGVDVVELDWLSFSASGASGSNSIAGSGEEFIGRARNNYTAWDPLPSEQEWAIESMIMRELGRRFSAAFVECTPVSADTVLSLSIRITSRAADSTVSVLSSASLAQQQ